MTSTAPALDTRAHASAIRALLEPALGGAKVYDHDQIPGSQDAATPELREADLPYIYTDLFVERRFLPAQRLTGQAGRSGWRVAVRCVGTTVREARWVLKQVNQTLDGAQVTVDGFTSTALLFESLTDAEPDDGRYSALVVFTYVA